MPNKDKEVLGIIRDADCGNRDFARPCIWFTVQSLSGDSLQVFWWEQAYELLQAAGVRSVKDLNGRACAVIEEGGMHRFSRILPCQ